MDVRLTAEQEWIVERRIQSGQNESADEVLSEALRALEERDAFTGLMRADVEPALVEAIQSLDLGEGLDADEVFEGLEAELDKEERGRP